MTSGLVLVLVVVGAYLAAHVAAEWLARRFLIVSGAEYLLLGILLGPQLANVIRPGVVDGFAPFLTLGLGWVGALVGAQFFLPDLLRLQPALYRVAFGEATLTFLALTATTGLLLVTGLDVPIERAMVAAAALGAIGTASAPSGIAMASRGVGQGAELVRQLQVNTAVDGLVAITAFGVLMSLAHTGQPVAVRPLTPTEWVVMSFAIGIGGGVLFHLFLGPEKSIDRLFIALSGALILASGAAAYLRLSPLLPTMLVGLVLVNTSRSREAVRLVLTRVERPLYFILLIFAGAAWQPGREGLLVVVAAFLGARLLIKLAAARLAARAAGTLPALGPMWGTGLFGHGGLALALGLSYQLLDSSALGSMVFTATIVSILLTDLLSARLVRRVVVGYGERMRRAGRRRRGLEAEAEAGQGAEASGRVPGADLEAAGGATRPEGDAAGRRHQAGEDV